MYQKHILQYLYDNNEYRLFPILLTLILIIMIHIVPHSNPVQPVHVRDMAELCIELANSSKNLDKDAVGPEKFTFKEFIQTIKGIVGGRSVLIPRVPE